MNIKNNRGIKSVLIVISAFISLTSCSEEALAEYTNELEWQYEEGYRDGYNDGYEEGEDAGRQHVYDEGYYIDGDYDSGFSDGYEYATNGHDYDSGYEAGRSEGYHEGYDEAEMDVSGDIISLLIENNYLTNELIVLLEENYDVYSYYNVNNTIHRESCDLLTLNANNLVFYDYIDELPLNINWCENCLCKYNEVKGTVHLTSCDIYWQYKHYTDEPIIEWYNALPPNAIMCTECLVD